jgi:hypothetical protein
MVILGALALTLAGCSAAATSSSHPASPSASTAPPTATSATPATNSSGYPQMAADQALCTAYQNLVQSGDAAGIPAAVAEAGSTITQSLATDMLRVANGTSFQQDLQNQVYVAMDCGIVAAGRQPIELKK